MTRFLFILSILLLLSNNYASENFRQVKVFVNIDELKSIADLGISLEGAHKTNDGGISIFVSDSEFEKLQALGFQLEVIIDDWKKYYSQREKFTDAEKNAQLNQTAAKFGVKNFEFGSLGGYYTLSEATAKMQELLDNYPNLVGGVEIIGKSVEGRDLIAFKLSDNPNNDEDEPEVLYTALHHAREPEGMMQMFYFIQYLLDNYQADDEVTYLLNNRELYFIPVVNPDGYFYNETISPNGGGMWRKNRSANDDGSFGVDLNRNYGPFEYWDAPNGGSSDEPSSYSYRGPEPFSEPEVSAIRSFLNNHEIKACLNYHTYSNLLIFPYGALESETADSNIFREYAVDMTAENNYSVGTDMQTVNYSTRGNSDDYMYDGEPGRDKIFAMTPEVGNFEDGFWPKQERIIPLAEENILPNLYYANIVGSYQSVIDLAIDKEFILPGDQFSLIPVIKNKGLQNSGEFEVKINSLNDAASVATENVLLIDELESRAIYQPETGFGIEVNSDIGDETDLVFEFDIIQNGLVRRTDTLNFKIGQPVVLFEDNADSLNAFWVSAGSGKKWSETKRYAFSGDKSYTDSKSGDYSSSTNTTLTLVNEINLTNLSNAYLYFQTRYHIESDFDGGFIEISSDGGASWNVVGGKLAKQANEFFENNRVNTGDPFYSGALFEWRQEEIDLNDFLGENILIKFTFYSDSWTVIDGWYLDDIKVVSYDFSTGVAEDGLNYQFSLEQNYPNPFNPSTTIKFTIPAVETPYGASLQTRLVVYDILGREVKTLINKDLPAGNYEVDFNTDNAFSSGIYFYRLKSGVYSQTRKMLLIK